MNTAARSFSSWSSDPLAFRCLCLYRRLWPRSWRVVWLLGVWSFAALAFCGDQLYLIGLEQHDVGKLEFAARLFPFERDIAIGPGMLYVIIWTDDRRALGAIRMAQEFDPYAADLLRGE